MKINNLIIDQDFSLRGDYEIICDEALIVFRIS